MKCLNCRNFVRAHAFLTVDIFSHTSQLHQSCNLGEFVWHTQIETGSQSFYFPCCSIFQRNFQTLAWRFWLCVPRKVFGVYIFSNFVLVQYIVVQKLVKANPRHLNTFCLFLLIAGGMYCSNLSKQEVKYSYYNLSIKGDKYQLHLFEI